MLINTVLFTVIFLIVNLNFSNGQDTNVQSWNTLVIDWNFHPSMLAEVEFEYDRLLSEGAAWREYIIQACFEYYPTNSLELFLGIHLASTKQNNVEDTRELRPFTGIRWNVTRAERRIFVRAQAKYEHRFFVSENEDKSENVSRLRARLDWIVSITRHNYTLDKNLYGLIWSELFFNFEENDIRERYKSRFRQYLGLGYRFSYSWRLELTYILQRSRDSISSETPDSVTHAISAKVKYYIPK